MRRFTRSCLKNNGKTIVYFVDSATFGGNEQALLHLLARLDRQRWQPVLFHHAEPGLAPLLVEVRRLQIKTRIVPRLQGAGAISGLPQFLTYLRQECVAIFHAHLNWLLSCKVGVIAAALARTPVVMATLQQFLLPPWAKNIYLQQQLVAAAVDQYIAVSDVVARQLCHSFHAPAAKVKTIHNSIPLTLYNGPANQALKANLNRGTGVPVVLTIARLDKQKGHNFLLEAVRQLPEAVFVLAGSGPEGEALQAQARALAIADRVLFLGHRPDVPDLLASCDLFVLPSLYEGFPLSILEAMAAGKAVVATAVGGVPEAVLDGQTGLLVPPADPAALANAIRSLLSAPSLAAKMGAGGKARVQSAFSVDVMAQQICHTYEELLDKRELAD
jgi:glycosyltransferase involved in cell wall biosynthesis